MDLKEQDTKQSGSLKTTNIAKKSLKKTFPIPLYMETLQKLILKQFQKLTSLQEDSHAKTSVLLEKVKELRGVVVHSGNITKKQLGFYDQNTHSLRMFQQSLIEDLMLPLQTLPRTGMMRNGIIYQHPRLVHFTKENDCLLLPTCRSKKSGDYQYSNGIKGRKTLTLTGIVKLFPTPRAQEKCQYNSKDKGMSLSRMVKMFPTPTKQDNRGKGKYKFDKSYFVDKKVTGQLNPTFVEWLMGFPIGWTELDALEMQLFRKSQKSLHKPLKKEKRVIK